MFNLAVQDDELLAQECILSEQLVPAAAQIGKGRMRNEAARRGTPFSPYKTGRITLLASARVSISTSALLEQ